jgi:hypothetical protein
LVGIPLLVGEPHSVCNLEVVEIHLAVVRGAILSPSHALEEDADGAPLLGLLVLRPQRVVRHERLTASERPVRPTHENAGKRILVAEVTDLVDSRPAAKSTRDIL